MRDAPAKDMAQPHVRTHSSVTGVCAEGSFTPDLFSFSDLLAFQLPLLLCFLLHIPKALVLPRQRSSGKWLPEELGACPYPLFLQRCE